MEDRAAPAPPDDARRHLLWCRLLQWGFGAQLLVGYSVAFAYRTPLWAWHRQPMARALWGTTDIPPLAAPVVDQLCAMLGATMACWGVAMVFLTRGPLARRESWAWWCVLWSTLSWAIVDTSMSALHGVWINVLFNLMPITLIAIPLAATRRSCLATPDA